MPKYQCPECDSILKRAEAVAPGKKIRCPKCEAVFAAKAMDDEEEETLKVAPEKPAKPKDDDDDDGGAYKVITTVKEDGPEIELGSLRHKFAKSKIGPAMYKTVRPSNWLLRLGLLTCVAAVFTVIFGLFPIVFCEVDPIRPFIRPRLTRWILPGIVNFCLGAVMCWGAAKLHDLSSLPVAIIGSVMSLLIYVPIGIYAMISLIFIWGPMGMLPGVFMIIISLTGIWCLVVIFNPAVRDGFRERAEEKTKIL